MSLHRSAPAGRARRPPTPRRPLPASADAARATEGRRRTRTLRPPPHRRSPRSPHTAATGRRRAHPRSVRTLVRFPSERRLHERPRRRLARKLSLTFVARARRRVSHGRATCRRVGFQTKRRMQQQPAPAPDAARSDAPARPDRARSPAPSRSPPATPTTHERRAWNLHDRPPPAPASTSKRIDASKRTGSRNRSSIAPIAHRTLHSPARSAAGASAGPSITGRCAATVSSR